jgi:putative endonuclease
MNHYYVYILTNKKYGTLYIGFTDNLKRRIKEHKNKSYEGFTAKYNLDKLMYYEILLSADEAKRREQQLKKWNRQWKIELIEKNNPEWNDLSHNLGKYLTETEKLNLLFGNN